MSRLHGARVLVTGGAGFIGSEVVRQLCNNGAHATVLDNFTSGKIQYLEELKVRAVKGDVCDKESLSDALRDQEIVFHLAALPFIPDCYVNPSEFFKVNAMGTVNVMWEAIQSESVEKFVHVSSSEVYGTAKYPLMNENHPTLPHSTYAASKLAADRAVLTLHKEHSFPAVIIRPFNSYGPRVTQPYIVPEIILQLLRGAQVYLGNVDSWRDFTYVSDTARGIILASVVKEAVGETINIGSGKDVKIRDLVKLIAELMGKADDVEICYDRSRLRPYDVDRLICDYSKANKILGWQPSVPLERGLTDTINWMKTNLVDFKEPFRGWPRVMKKNSDVRARPS